MRTKDTFIKLQLVFHCHHINSYIAYVIKFFGWWQLYFRVSCAYDVDDNAQEKQEKATEVIIDRLQAD